MVVLCPNCGREIFSDPDYCVLCGWKREESPPPRRTGDTRFGGPSQRQPGGPPPARRGYDAKSQRPHGDRYEARPTKQPRYDDRRPAPSRPVYRDRGEYDERYRERPPERRSPPPPQVREQRQNYEDRRQPPQRQQRPQSRTFRPGYETDARRPPPRDTGGRGMGRQDINTCPNCGREIFTDPDNCVLCGWSRESEQRGAQPQPEQRPRYSQAPSREYREPRYTDERRPREREIPYSNERDREYRQERIKRGPPEDWERRVNRKLGVKGPKPKDEGRFWYRSKEESPEKDRFVCENCGNPSLQFFADGLGRCPGCGQRFRYSPRPVSPRSKQKHKQFVCSKCDSKNLQFFLDGTGACPHCKREFKWKK